LIQSPLRRVSALDVWILRIRHFDWEIKNWNGTKIEWPVSIDIGIVGKEKLFLYLCSPLSPLRWMISSSAAMFGQRSR
jgi:hypothetical protein